MYDPLGWLSPVTIVGKLFMPRLWLEEINWDQELDVNDLSKGKLYEEYFLFLENIRIPRWIKTHVNSRYSSFQNLERIRASVLRLIGIKVKKASYPTFLTVDELKSARVLIIKKQQERQFISEIVCCRDGNQIQSKCKIFGLHPFLYTDGVLRVG